MKHVEGENMSYYRELSNPWVKAQKFQDVKVSDLLKRAKKRLEKRSEPQKNPAWVFDLDSTLFCTGPRNQKVFWKFLQKQEEFPKHWGLLWQQMGPAVQQYSIPRTFYSVLRSFGWSPDEARAEAKAIWDAYQGHWMEEFFKSQNIAHDPAYPGAVEFVRAILEMENEVIYLTGRDSPRAMEGTLHALKMAGFPLGNGTHLRLKPVQEMGDLDFKLKASSRMKSEFEVIGLLENEPENLVMFAKLFPDAEIVFYHSIMSARHPEKDIRDYMNGRPLWKLDNFSS